MISEMVMFVVNIFGMLGSELNAGKRKNLCVKQQFYPTIALQLAKFYKMNTSATGKRSIVCDKTTKLSTKVCCVLSKHAIMVTYS